MWAVVVWPKVVLVLVRRRRPCLVPAFLISPAPPLRNGSTQIRGSNQQRLPVQPQHGALSSNLINYGTVKLGNDLGWRISLSVASIPAAVLAQGAIFLPETPNSLIQLTQNHHKAKLILQRIRGTNDVQAELDDLVKASDVSKTNLHPFHEKTQRKYRPQVVMAIAIPFFQQVTGINAIAFYVPILFRTAGLGKSADSVCSCDQDCQCFIDVYIHVGGG
ncbi:hypothetical protein RHSIM_Rhsim09G0190100 [Rhododendron simsii]|uniref:Uncharacterized protein n=1 Tax=Rhododendron simsii TaxID=118357 RepID=A0A834LEW5_RHOSS|nr:hypothetical protein RHSIM_Rhsim09G0190100 [Rhododendron simsii]